MTFRPYDPCDGGNGPACGATILAQGAIATDTPEKFLAFAKLTDARTVVLDSPGGDLAAAVRFGQAIRALGMDTRLVAQIVGTDLSSSKSRPAGTVPTERSVCASACAYAFAGGVDRTVEDGALIGLHQFRGAKSEIGERQAQATTALLGQYLEKMGVDRRAQDRASLTAPTEVSFLTVAEQRRLRVDNGHAPLAAWKLSIRPDGLPLTVLEQEQTGHRRVFMSIYNSGQTYILSVMTVLSPAYFDKRFGQIGEEIDADPQLPTIGFDGDKISLTAISGWHALDKGAPGYYAEYALPSALFSNLTRSATFTFNAGLPN